MSLTVPPSPPPPDESLAAPAYDGVCLDAALVGDGRMAARGVGMGASAGEATCGICGMGCIMPGGICCMCCMCCICTPPGATICVCVICICICGG